VSKPRAARNPLEPIATAVRWAFGLFVVAILLSTLSHQALWGNGPVCTYLSAHGGPLIGGRVSVLGLAAGSKASLASAQICSSNPTPALRLAGVAAAWPYLVLWVFFLFRLGGLLQSASQPGELYSAATAARLRRLGWLMTGGGIAASLIASTARIFIFTHLVRYAGLGWFEPSQVNFDFWALIVGLTLISVARVMRLGVTMREELDVTV
jgi:hypothetical protein